jgi:hypothetical protein
VALEGWLFGAVPAHQRVLAGLAAACLITAPELGPLGIAGYVWNGVGALGLGWLLVTRGRARSEPRPDGEAAPS